jgi:hypothetical protein
MRRTRESRGRTSAGRWRRSGCSGQPSWHVRGPGGPGPAWATSSFGISTLASATASFSVAASFADFSLLRRLWGRKDRPISREQPHRLTQLVFAAPLIGWDSSCERGVRGSLIDQRDDDSLAGGSVRRALVRRPGDTLRGRRVCHSEGLQRAFRPDRHSGTPTGRAHRPKPAARLRSRVPSRFTTEPGHRQMRFPQVVVDSRSNRPRRTGNIGAPTVQMAEALAHVLPEWRRALAAPSYSSVRPRATTSTGPADRAGRAAFRSIERSHSVW